MKNNKLIIGIIAVFALCFVLVGCGKNDIVGKYTLESMTMGGETLKAADLKELGGTATIEFKKDGTGVMDLFGEKQNFKYDKKYPKTFINIKKGFR